MHQLSDVIPTIVVRERGVTALSAAEWTSLALDPEFWELCRAKIVSVDLSKPGQHRLAGSCYTGKVALRGCQLILEEKFPGATEALLAQLQPKKKKDAEVYGYGDYDYGPLRALVARYLPAVKTYLSGFRKVRYAEQSLTGTLAGGRLDVRGTIKLRIGGKGHRLSYRKSEISTDLPYNVCIYAALKQVERLAKYVDLPSSLIAMARALRTPIADCGSRSAGLSSRELRELARQQVKVHASSRSELSIPIELALLLLEATPNETNDSERTEVRRSWFLNLENLFEASVRECIRRVMGHAYSVTSSQKRPDLFKPDLGRYKANPDVVVKAFNGQSIMIADAKYKDLDGWPSASDVHELLAHAAGYSSPNAAIFYPSDDEYRTKEFGTAVTGCKVIAFGIRFANFEQDVRRSLMLIGLVDNDV